MVMTLMATGFTLLLSINSASLRSTALAQSAEPVTEQVIDPADHSDAEQRQRWDQKGNDVFHETWSRLRESEPTWKDIAIRSRPSGMVGTTWHYTKFVLKALFMNAPTSKVETGSADNAVDGSLKRAVERLENLAQRGHQPAEFLLAEMNLHGNFSHPRNLTEALKWYLKVADAGNSTAQYITGLLYATGLGGVEQDQAKAMLYHNFAAEQGNTRSEMTLAFRHHAGIGTSRDCNKAVEYYKRVADKAMQFWKDGPPGGRSLPRNSYRWVEADGGTYGEGASASSSGPNAPKDNVLASDLDNVLEYYSLRESSGDFGATYALGKHYYEPPRGYKRNLRKAQKQFMKVAKAHWTEDGKLNPKGPKGIESLAGKAAAYIGRMLLRGEYVKQNYPRALMWFRRGVANGDPFAQYHLGIMYRDGLGVPQDGTRGATYLKASAEQGLAIAQSALGGLFLDQGDIDTAGRYFEHAAAYGVMEAFYYLAELYNNGVGRDRNCGLAAAYYKVVSERVENLHTAPLEANAAYERGDFERALIPTIMAAEQGYENAQANAAYLLDTKSSIITISNIPFLSSPSTNPTRSPLLSDPALALVYYTRSAKQVNTDSLVKVGDYYLSGFSTPATTADSPTTSPLAIGAPELEKATTCYTSAAEGHHSAQALWNLGWMHENGIGSISQDFHMAKRYYDLALEMNKEAYLPVKLALGKLRLRSWWNGISGGKINSIREEEDEKGPKSFMEWLYRFLDAAEEMDAAEAAQQRAEGDDGLEGIAFGEPGMPGGDAEYANRHQQQDAGVGGTEYDGAEWEEFDDGLVESLIIIALAGALAMLVYARQQRQRGGEEERRRNGQAGGVQGLQGPNGQAGQGAQGPPAQQQAVQQPQQQQAQGQGEGGGFFPRPGDPEYNNWVAGGVGH